MNSGEDEDTGLRIDLKVIAPRRQTGLQETGFFSGLGVFTISANREAAPVSA